MPRHQKTVSISSFKGLNNVLKPENTPNDYLKKAINVNIDKQGNILKRKGYSLEDTANYTSIWASNLQDKCYAIRNGDLVSIKEDFSFDVLKAGVGNDPVSFEEVDKVVYYTSVSHNGIIEDEVVRSWGLPLSDSPSVSQVFGILRAGTYQVSITFVDSNGRESGHKAASIITVPTNSGISVQIPFVSDPRIISANIYCSTTNGRLLYYSGNSPINSVYTISTVVSVSTPMRLVNRYPPPLASEVRYYKGRLYISSGRTLWFSGPNQYEFFELDSDYIEMPCDITDVIPVEDGIWIAADNIYYISGTEPSSFKLSLKERVQIVPGTAKRFSGSYIRLDNTPAGYKWLITTNLGIFVLFNQGLIINLTATNLSLEQGSSGTSLFLQEEGLNQYLSIIKKKDKPNNSVVGDIVTTSVIRNGITISS